MEDNVNRDWKELLIKIEEQFENYPDLQAILFLIGVQELGKGAKNFSKQEKQDLIHIAICTLLSEEGFYKFTGVDQDGWPHWEVNKTIPKLPLMQQEKLLKSMVLKYFEEQFD